MNDARNTQAIDMGNYHSLKKKTTTKPQAQDAGTAANANAKSVAQDAAPPPTTVVMEDGELTPLQFISNMTGQHKPLDASDVTPNTLQDAIDEIKFIRKFAADYLAAWEGTVGDDSGESILAGNVGGGLGLADSKSEDKDSHMDQAVRFAMYDKPEQDFTSFTKITYDKTPEVRELIYNAIRPNALFEFDTKEELLQIIDVFKPGTIVNEGTVCGTTG